MGFDSLAFRMRDVEIGWLAGIIDGEGSISLDPRNGTRMPRLSVPSTDIEILRKCVEITGTGNITKRNSRNSKHKETWQWRTSGSRKTIAILKQISKYLQCPKKAKRAFFLIENIDRLCKIGGSYTTEELQLRTNLWNEFYSLGI